MDKYTIDRFEGELAVLLLRKDESVKVDVPRSQLPEEVKEGDILKVKFAKDGQVTDAIILKEETEAARKKAEELLRKIFE